MSGAELLDCEPICGPFGLLAGQHEQRRRDGLPTVTTIVGHVALGQRLWKLWAAEHRRPVVVATGTSRQEWLVQWVAGLVNARDLYADADEYIALRMCPDMKKSQLRLREKTLHEIGLILERAQLSDFGLEPDRLCRWLLRHRAKGKLLTADELVGRQLSWIQSTASSTPSAFRQLIGLLKTALTPALLVKADPLTTHSDKECRQSEIQANLPVDLVSAPPQEGPLRCQATSSALHRLAAELTKLATCVPELTVGLVVDEASWATYLQQIPESFSKAVVQENVIALGGIVIPARGQLETGAAARDVVASTLVSTEIPDLSAAYDLAPEQPDLSQRATSACTPDLGLLSLESKLAVDLDPWKSEQERFLFELLEATPDLSGLFQLNVDPGFKFGNRPAEVDLACLSLKIAIEVDGYFHFQDLDSYRRDRRKDLKLQRHGYLVVRFLADDIVPEMNRILQVVREAVKYRRAELHSAPKRERTH